MTILMTSVVSVEFAEWRFWFTCWLSVCKTVHVKLHSSRHLYHMTLCYTLIQDTCLLFRELISFERYQEERGIRKLIQMLLMPVVLPILYMFMSFGSHYGCCRFYETLSCFDWRWRIWKVSNETPIYRRILISN